MQFKNNVNFNLKQLKNAIIEKLANEPTTDLVSGRVYYNTTSNKFFIYNGTAWSQLSDQSMSASDILTAIKTVDGSGSGLDADLLDGNSSAYFMPASTTLNNIPAPTADVSMNGRAITGLSMPTASPAPTDAATRQFVVDSISAVVNGLDPKESVWVATTAYIDLSTIGANITIDGVFVPNGVRVLVKNQTTKSENGIYISSTTAWQRAADATVGVGGKLGDGAYVFVENGTEQGKGWIYNATTLDWTKFSEQTVITNGTGIGTSTSGGTTTVSIDTAVVARKVVATLGASSANSPINVNHNLNTLTVVASVIEDSTKEIVLADVSIFDENNIRVTFADAVTNGQYRVIVVG